MRLPFSWQPRVEPPQAESATPDSAESAIAISTLPKPLPHPSPPRTAPSSPSPPPVSAASPPVSAAPQPAPPPTTTPEPIPEPTSEPAPEPTPEPTPTPSPATVEAGIVIPFRDDFPHPVGSTAGCFALQNCRRLENIGSYRQTAQDLVAQLEAQGYQVTHRDDADNTGLKLYEIIDTRDPDGTVQYLSIFSDGIGSAVYTITQEIISLEELRELG
ncbi:MAG: hypothetical protein AAF152_12725 [Cyanobacteria bacterium P01_A01_bin.114]